MKALLALPFVVAALLVFTALAQAWLPALLGPLFIATADDPDILATMVYGALIAVLLMILIQHRRSTR